MDGAECLFLERRKRGRWERHSLSGGQRDLKMPERGGERGTDTPDPDIWSEWIDPCWGRERQEQRDRDKKTF